MNEVREAPARTHERENAIHPGMEGRDLSKVTPSG